MEAAIAFVPFLLVLAFWIAMAFGGGYVVLRLLRAYEQRGTEPQRLAALTSRVHALEETIEQMETSVAEIAEAQRFTTRLLEERAGEREPAPLRELPPPADDPR